MAEPIGLPAGFVLDQAAAVPAELPQGFVLDQQEQPQDDGGALQTAGNVLAGAVRGAGSIGATILAPVDIAKDALDGKGLSLESNRQRRAAMDAGLQSLGAQPDSLAYRGGKIATEIVGTAPIGGLLGRGATMAGTSPKVAAALGSGGFSLGGAPAATNIAGRVADTALRAGAGGVVGGATAGLVDPEQAGTGAVIGGAMPGAVKIAGAAGKAVKNAGSGLLSHVLGTTTGAGSEAIKVAYQSGKNGIDDFLKNMRGQAEFDDVVDAAKQGLSSMRMERQAAYRSGMADISKDKSVLNFAPVDKAMSAVSDIGRFKGVSIKSKAADTVDELRSIVDQWKSLDPAEYHTPEGLDALKQSIGDVRDSVQYGTPARRAADQMYNTVKGEIVKQAPAYAKVMRDYQSASNTLSEVEKALSLGNKASKDTAVRKLQSLLRNNAQTNYGNRLNLAKQLEEQGGVELMPSIAGQALNSWTPRGMVGSIEKAGMGATALLQPQLLAAAPFTSPRMVGEAAYAMGRGVGGAQNAIRPVSNSLNDLLMAQRQGPASDLLRAASLITLSNQAGRR